MTRLLAVLLLMVFVLPATPASTVSQQQPPPGRDQALAEETMRLLADMSRAKDIKRWFADHGDEVTPEVAEMADRIARVRARAGELPHAELIAGLAALMHLHLGDRAQSLESMLFQHEVQFTRAEKPDEYATVRKSALGMAARAKDIDAMGVAFGFYVTAADCAYFQSRDLTGEAQEQALLSGLEDLAAAAPLSRFAPSRLSTERFVSLTAVSVDEATERFHADQERFDAPLKTIAGATEQGIPADFDFTEKAVGDRRKSIEVARRLAYLSYQYGSAAVASARLAIAERRADELGDPELVVGLIYARYRGERRKGAAADQLQRLRTDAWTRAQAIRAKYRSRAGRIWAESISDTLYGEMLNGQVTDPAAADVVGVFSSAELLKARTLLDRLTLPNTIEIETDQARALEKQILGFSPPKPDDDLTTQELRLSSQLAGFQQSCDEGPQRLKALGQLEQLHATGGAGFAAVATPTSLRAVQGALQPGEALLEYVIPYHPLHPAQDLWMALVTREKVWSAHVPLDKVLGLAQGFTGRMAVDCAPPIDASALGELVVTARVAIRGSDEKRAKAVLHTLHDVLIQPLLDQGVRLESFSRLIVVPHGALHYVPFPALIDEDGKFLITRAPITIAPSASVWSVLQARTSSADRFLAWADPPLAGRDLARLPFAEQEATAAATIVRAASHQVFAGPAATRDRFLAEAGSASLVHLSTHGEFPDESALDLHAIWLGAPDGKGVPLRAADVRKLKMQNARLVVLSVCDGGLYRTGPSDEPYGLIPAFLEAGAHNVMGTLWPLDDQFGRDFMIEFYKHLGGGPAAAYQKAALRFIGEDEFIRRWAGFVLVGPGRPFATAAGAVRPE